jgi:L-iditol 2-dehydrogenase
LAGARSRLVAARIEERVPMKALVLSGARQLRLSEVTEPALTPGEVRVQIAFAGICGTDLRLYEGTKIVKYPRIIGHEFAGRIAEVSAEAGLWAVGQRVVVYPTITCGECYACRAGRENICVRRQTIGYEYDGGFAERVVIPAAAVARGNVIAVPDSISDQEAALTEPVAAALQGVHRAGVATGSEVIILGGGPIGLAHARLCRLAGASLIAVSEPQQSRRDAARKVGVDAVIDPGAAPLASSVREVFGEAGPDIAFIDVGLPGLVPAAVGLLRKGGRCVVFAGMAEGAKCELEPNAIHYREVDLIGSSSSTPANQAEVLRLAAEGQFELRALLSDVLPLDSWEIGFDMKERAAGLRVLLDFGGR